MLRNEQRLRRKKTVPLQASMSTIFFCKTISDKRELAGKPPENGAKEAERKIFLKAPVDKSLHIHRMQCGKTRLLSTSIFLSTFDASSIQSLYALFCALQADDF
jgi:hypothetical protein